MLGFEPVADVTVGGWIAGRLRGPLGTVGSVVPRGFAAYARVLHPVELGDSRTPLTWAQVCRFTGRIPHALMQWAAIATPTAEADVAAGQIRSGRWDDGDVRMGSLAPAALSALIDVLAPATGGQDCFHALWEGWGWVDGSGVMVSSSGDDGRTDPAPAPEPGVSAEVWALPRLRLPDRDHLLFRGPLRAALDLGWRGSPGGFEAQSPSLLWPANHSCASVPRSTSSPPSSADPTTSSAPCSPHPAWRYGRSNPTMTSPHSPTCSTPRPEPAHHRLSQALLALPMASRILSRSRTRMVVVTSRRASASGW